MRGEVGMFGGPDMQSESESAAEYGDCVVRVSESEFLQLLKRVAAAVGQHEDR